MPHTFAYDTNLSKKKTARGHGHDAPGAAGDFFQMSANYAYAWARIAWCLHRIMT